MNGFIGTTNRNGWALKNRISILACLFLASIMPIRLTVADVTMEYEKADDGGTVVVHRLTVTPAALPSPAFRHRLTVPLYKTRPGNAATHYLRSDGENSLRGPWKSATDKFGFEVHDWASNAIPMDDVPVNKLREAASYFDSYIDNHIRRATVCRDCDWGLAEEDMTGKEAIEFLLPSAQQTRSISRALALRTRLAVIDRRYDDAIDHLRMNYQLGSNVSKMKFLVTSLIGVAEVGIANEGMIGLIAAPDSPNMYWALAELPHPMISIRESMRLEMSIIKRYIPALQTAESDRHSTEQWAEIHLRTIESMMEAQTLTSSSQRNHSKSHLPMWSLLSGLANYSQAKRRLIDSGMELNLVEAMPVGQVLMIDASRDVQKIADDFEKMTYVPIRETRRFSQVAEAMTQEMANELRLGALLGNVLWPAVSQVHVASVRVQRQLNAIQTVEAIRMHLASTGKLPASLEEIAVPVPLNPLTGRPFVYRLESGVAIIEMPRSDGGFVTRRFEIRVAPTK